MIVVTVRKLGLAACASVVSLLAVGCASAPISIDPDTASTAGEARPQTELRSLAAAVEVRIRENGWTLRPAASDGARRLLGRLIGGGSPQPVAENGSDPVALYLTRNPADAALVDMAELMGDAAALGGLVAEVAAFERGLDAASLNLDIAAAEGALAAVRRAAAFFEAVGDASDLDGDREAVFDAQLADLRRAQRGLALAADALAERRWASSRADLTS